METIAPSPRVTKAVNLKEVAELMVNTMRLEEGISGKRDADYESQITAVGMGIFKLVVMGEIKQGKSSLINALLGIDQLLPVARDVATSCVFKLRYGESTKYTAYFLRDGSDEPVRKQEITKEQLPEFGTEDGNPKNVTRVDFIAVEAPSPFMKEGFLIVDTPGVGGLFKEHRKITFRYAPKADAVLFVTDSSKPFGQDEISFLKELYKTTNLVYFVQTKKDIAPSIEAREQVKVRNIEILTSQIGIPKGSIRYWIVSSNDRIEAERTKSLEDLKDSGFIPLVRFLQTELQPQKDANLAVIASNRSLVKLGLLDAQLQEKTRILDADTAEKRKEITSELSAAEAALKEWDVQKRPALNREFNTELRRIQSDALTAMEDFLAPEGKFARDAQNELLALATGPEIAQHLPVVINEVRAAASQFLLGQIEQLTKDVAKLAQALAVKADAELTSSALIPVGPGGVVIATEMPLAEFSKRFIGPTDFDRTRMVRSAWSMYGNTGAGIGAMVGMIVPFVGPVLGGAAGWIIGGFYGSMQADNDMNHKQRDAVLAYATGAINDQCRNCFRVTRNEFAKAFNQVESKLNEMLSAAVESAKSGFEARRREIGERAGSTQQMLAQQRADLQNKRASLDGLHKRFTGIQQTFQVVV